LCLKSTGLRLYVCVCGCVYLVIRIHYFLVCDMTQINIYFENLFEEEKKELCTAYTLEDVCIILLKLVR
jgi:hypothetical protein